MSNRLFIGILECDEKFSAHNVFMKTILLRYKMIYLYK